MMLDFQAARTLRNLVFLGAALSMGLQADVNPFDVHSTGANVSGVDPNYNVIVSPGPLCHDDGGSWVHPDQISEF